MTGIRLRRLAKAYRGQRVLDGIDLDVADGALVALLGPSGCGKTTLLRLIAGFERPDEGEIGMGATVVESGDRFVPPEQRHVGYVPQEGALFPHLTVAANIGYGLRGRSDKAARVREMLDLVGLGDHTEKYPRELSGGQQQRVALARALAPRPSLILLDEPFSALDLDLRRRMSADVITVLRNVGTTALLVTHDPAEAFAAVDLVAVMHGGTIMQCGTPVEVYRAPASPQAARLTGRAILLEGTVRDGKAQTVLGAIPVAGHSPGEGHGVTVLLRPEQIRLALPGQGLEAVVHECRFLGSRSVVTVMVGGLSLDIETEEPPAGPVVALQVRGGCRAFGEAGAPIVPAAG
ncbi:MAG: ABC transporter ATP-binding protein [Parvibaculaceae bacterium]